MFFNDVHFPWQNDRALELALQIGDKAKPDLIVIDGDLLDMWEISKFLKNPADRDKGQLTKEIKQGRNFLRDLRKRFPRARIILIFGNHEHRWTIYIASHAQELYGLEGMTLQEQLHLAEYEIEHVYSGNKESSWLWSKLLIGHFDLCRKDSAYTARALIEKKGISVMQAHTHRGGSCFKRMWDRDVVAYENFCLCNRNPSYADRPDWQLGFSLVYKDRASDHFFVEPHPIAEIHARTMKAFFNGECYAN